MKTTGEIIAAEFSTDKVSLSDAEQRRLAGMIDKAMMLINLRDEFAGKAMQGDLASQSLETGEWTDSSFAMLAKRCYEIADWMIAARNQ